MAHGTISGEEMVVVELNANAIGIPFACMMENAGSETARIVLSRTATNPRIAILCGTGNNGGDGFVAARHIISKNDSAIVELFLIGGGADNIRKDESTLNWDILRKIHSPRLKIHPKIIPEKIALTGFNVIIDALLGTGLNGEVREPYRTVIQKINAQKGRAKIFSLDVPSGTHATSGEVFGVTVKADCTISFHKEKAGLVGNENAGEIIVADIGIPI